MTPETVIEMKAGLIAMGLGIVAVFVVAVTVEIIADILKGKDDE